MGSYGYTGVMRQILRTSFLRLAASPSNWRMGELMIASASYYELTGDRPYLRWVTPRVGWFMTLLSRQMHRDPHGLLGRSASRRTSRRRSTGCTRRPRSGRG